MSGVPIRFFREVVSNAYDADATEARIDVDLRKDRVVVHDNGTGMTRERDQLLLQIAGQSRGKRETPKFGRKRIGRFGVGFLRPSFHSARPCR